MNRKLLVVLVTSECDCGLFLFPEDTHHRDMIKSVDSLTLNVDEMTDEQADFIIKLSDALYAATYPDSQFAEPNEFNDILSAIGKRTASNLLKFENVLVVESFVIKNYQ